MYVEKAFCPAHDPLELTCLKLTHTSQDTKVVSLMSETQAKTVYWGRMAMKSGQLRAFHTDGEMVSLLTNL